jgi:WD40 repeat protein
VRPLGKPLTFRSPIAFSPNGQLLASASDSDQAVILWDVKHQQAVGKPLSVPNQTVSSLAFSPDGRTLAIGSESEDEEGGKVTLWDVGQQEALGKPFIGSGYNVAFAPDGQTLVAVGQRGVILWDADMESWRKKACDLLRPLADSENNAGLSRQEYQRLCG